MTAGIEQKFYFNPWDPVFRPDPYPHYKALLAGPPRTFEMMVPMALVARYADVVAVLHDHERFSSVRPRIPVFQQREAQLFREGQTVLFSDPPTHTRLRRLVSRAFTPKRIKDLEPRIREITGQLLDRAAARGELEVMGDLATPLPVMVITEMLGVPSADYAKFKRWSDLIIERNATPPNEPIPEESKQAALDLRAYFAEEIAARRRRPSQDLISVLVAAHDEAEALSEDELLAFVVLLLIAGNETTTNLIGNGTLALARNPGQQRLLRDERSLMASAVEEMLRYDCPVQTVLRRPTVDIEIAGTTLKADTLTFVILAAANHDPAQFPNPDVFDIKRAPGAHVAFGDGIHYCLGAALARLEANTAFSMMIDRFPRIALAEPEAPATYKGSYALRGLASLRIAIG